MTQELLFDVDPQARRANDFYETPAWMTCALVRRLRPYGRVLEPCAGRGAIVRVLDATCEVWANEPFPQEGADVSLNSFEDATNPETWQAPPFNDSDFVITNPPFVLADRIVPLALQSAPCIAMLLRLSWLEPTEARAAFLSAHPPTNLVVMPRHDFRGDGQTDSVTSAWFIWDRRFHRLVRGSDIEVVTREERDALVAEAARA